LYKNILIPVVLEEHAKSDDAFNAAKALADEGARFTILHVAEEVPAYVAEFIPADVIASARETASERLKELAAKLPGSHAVTAEGRAGPRIEKWAKENSIDCIIVASHQPAFTDILLGSVAQHVVRHAKCAVHVVR